MQLQQQQQQLLWRLLFIPLLLPCANHQILPVPYQERCDGLKEAFGLTVVSV
jgi:hypothetical protein